MFFFEQRENKKNPIVTIKNLKARAEKGSLLSIKGLVVINAEDQRTTNTNGNILTIFSYRLKICLISRLFSLIWTTYILSLISKSPKFSS